LYFEDFIFVIGGENEFHIFDVINEGKDTKF
jgi:hypothetical protein